MSPSDEQENTDEELMARVQARDSAALERLMDRHVGALHGYLYRMNSNLSDVDDLCQETFLRVWQHAGRWRPARARFSTWLFRIGHNLCIDRYRKHRPLAPDGPGEPGIRDEPASLRGAPDHAFEEEQRRQTVRAAIAELPERQRSALLLCQFNGMSNQQVADILQISVAAVESLLGRARRTLKRQLVQLILPSQDPRPCHECH